MYAFMIWPTNCWKYCISTLTIDAKMDIFARNRTLSHMRTNEPWISKRNCALFIVYIYISPYSRKQVMGFHANGGGLDQTAQMPFITIDIYVERYNVRLLLQWPGQFESLIRRSVIARETWKSCRFYVSLSLLHVYLLVVTFSIYFITTEWLFKIYRYCSERRQIFIIIIIIIIIIP